MKIHIPGTSKLLYYILFLTTIKSLLSYSTIIPYNNFADNILVGLNCGLLVLHVASKKMTLKICLYYLILAGIGLYSTVVTGNYGFLIPVLFVIALRNENLNKVFECIYIIQILYMILHTALALILAIIYDKSVIITNYRFTFGFSHPNTFAVSLFTAILLWTWSNWDIITIKSMGVILLISGIAFCFTKSDIAFLLSLILIVFLFASKLRFKYLRKILKIAAQFIFPVFCALCLFLMAIFTSGNVYVQAINSLFTQRIRLGSYAYHNFGVTFWGQYILKSSVAWDEVYGINNFTFDNVYSFLAMNMGFIWIVAISLSFFKLAKMENNKINIFLIIWSLYGLATTNILTGISSFPLWLICILMSKEAVVKTYLNDKLY